MEGCIWRAISMLNSIYKIFKRIVPRYILNLRHLWYARKGARKFGYPSEELFVIGVTGTSGKSSVVFYLRQLLERCGFTVGSLSTIDFYIAGENKLNDQKMTMLGKMQIQKYLREMVDKGCNIAIIETTSEGRLQHRHRYINYDMMVLTNLYPEHIRSHGSFEQYKQAKIDLFEYVSECKRKTLQHFGIRTTSRIPKIALACTDHAEVDIEKEFLSFNFDEVYEFSAYKPETATNTTAWTIDDIFYLRKISQTETAHPSDDMLYTHELERGHNELNKTIAASIAKILSVDEQRIRNELDVLVNPPGRVEFIHEAIQFGFNVIVDYAFEPVALSALYGTAAVAAAKRVIHVSGNAGGGRDKPHDKAHLIAAQADIVIITNEDPYDDDPMAIINEMADIIASQGKMEQETLFRIPERQDAIQKAIDLAEPGDIVLVTGKGSEQAMCLSNGKKIPWDDRVAVRKALENRI